MKYLFPIAMAVAARQKEAKRVETVLPAILIVMQFKCYPVTIAIYPIYPYLYVRAPSSSPKSKPQAKAKQVYFKMQFTLQNNRGVHKLQIACAGWVFQWH